MVIQIAKKISSMKMMHYLIQNNSNGCYALWHIQKTCLRILKNMAIVATPKHYMRVPLHKSAIC